MDNTVIFLDKCYEDATWFKKEFPNTYILLNNHHLITRYMNNSNGNDKARHTLFMKETPKIKIVEPRTPMRLGESIYSLKDQHI
jgi:hypothetical protein